jgi:hypothetical protein
MNDPGVVSGCEQLEAWMATFSILKYDESMSGKVRKTLTLDPEIVSALGDDPVALSATVNAILLEEIERRERHAALGSFLDRLSAEHGEPDPDLVDHFKRIVGVGSHPATPAACCP